MSPFSMASGEGGEETIVGLSLLGVARCCCVYLGRGLDVL